MNNLEINFEIITQSAFFIGSGLGIAGIVDRGCLKDNKGFIYIPGSSIKGKVRYYTKRLVQQPYFKTTLPICETLTNPEICKFEPPCVICRLFGSRYTEGALNFLDAKLNKEFQSIIKKNNPLDIKYQTSLRSNNKINRYTRTTEEGHLFTTETGEYGFIFNGKITGNLGGIVIEKVPIELAVLLAGIRLVDSIGGQKSRGLGKCNVNITNVLINGELYLLSDLSEELKIEWSSIVTGEAI